MCPALCCQIAKKIDSACKSIVTVAGSNIYTLIYL